jgi:hypothetical protein
VSTLGDVAVLVVILSLLGIVVAAGLVWRCGIRKNIRRPIAIAIDLILIGLTALSGWGLPIAAYALIRDSHYYGWWGKADRKRPSRPWLGQHPQNPGKSWERPEDVMANRQAVGNLAAQVAEYCAAYGLTFAMTHATDGTPRFVIDGAEYRPGEAADKFLQFGFRGSLGRGYR